ncbi:hypothetical protein Tco_1554627 [Tanacetum coccineum]
MKKKVQIILDEEAAKRLQAEFDLEERLAREKDEANVALTEEWYEANDKGKGIMIEEPVKPMKKKVQIMLDKEATKRLKAKFDEEERYILGATTQRETRSYYPKRNWELLPKEILGATTHRDTGSYYPKRYLELLPKEILRDTTQRDTGSYYPKRYWDFLWENGGSLIEGKSVSSEMRLYGSTMISTRAGKFSISMESNGIATQPEGNMSSLSVMVLVSKLHKVKRISLID